jgi:hypothetical protein
MTSVHLNLKVLHTDIAMMKYHLILNIRLIKMMNGLMMLITLTRKLLMNLSKNYQFILLTI